MTKRLRLTSFVLVAFVMGLMISFAQTREQQQPYAVSINVSDLQSGMYMIEIVTNNKNFIQKFIKK